MVFSYFSGNRSKDRGENMVFQWNSAIPARYIPVRFSDLDGFVWLYRDNN